MKNLSIFKYNLKTTALLVTAFVIFFGALYSNKTYAATCSVGECRSGWWVCDSSPLTGGYDDMCCYANGCPSDDCQKSNNGCWYGAVGVCTEKTPGACPKTSTETDDAWPRTRTECLDEGLCWFSPKCKERLSPTCPENAINNRIYINPVDKCEYCAGGSICTDTAPDQVTLQSPANGTSFQNAGTVVLDWNAIAGWGENCTGDESKIYRVYVDKGDGVGFVQQGGNILDPTTEITYALDTSVNRTYSWYVISDNGTETNTSATYIFTNVTKMELTVTVKETLYDTNACPGTSIRVLPKASVYEPTTNLSYITDANGQVKMTLSYSPSKTIQLCPSYSEDMCQTYSVRCADSTKYDTQQNCITINQTTTLTTQTTTLQMSKIKKDPWVAVVDGDAFSRTFTNPGPCSSETAMTQTKEKKFYGGMLNLNKLSLGSNIYALSMRNSPFPPDISEGTGGGYAKNIGEEEVVSERLDIKIPDTARTLTNLGGQIRPGVHKMSVADFNGSSGLYYFPLTGTSYLTPIPSPYDSPRQFTGGYRVSNSPAVAFVYVEGNPSDTLIIDSPIKSTAAPLGVTTAPGNVVIITKAHVKIDPSLSTPLSTFNPDTPPQVEAVIISSTGIEVGSDYTEVSPDDPIVFNGSLINTKPGGSLNKGLQMLRDLGLGNNTHPATAVNYPLDLLDKVTKFIKYNSERGIKTGLEVFDVRYEFENVRETEN